jgi:hypothetical protein
MPISINQKYGAAIQFRENSCTIELARSPGAEIVADLRSLSKNPGFIVMADGGGPIMFNSLVSMPEIFTERTHDDALTWNLCFPRTYCGAEVADANAKNLEVDHGLTVVVWDLRECPEDETGENAMVPAA